MPPPVKDSTRMGAARHGSPGWRLSPGAEGTCCIQVGTEHRAEGDDRRRLVRASLLEAPRVTSRQIWVAASRFGANVPEQLVYPNAAVDGDGEPLTGDDRYTLRFAADQIPPVTVFWNMTHVRPGPAVASRTTSAATSSAAPPTASKPIRTDPSPSSSSTTGRRTPRTGCDRLGAVQAHHAHVRSTNPGPGGHLPAATGHQGQLAQAGGS